MDNENDSSVVRRGVPNEQTSNEIEPTAQQNNEEQARRPSRLESVLSILKTVAIRGLMIYFVTSFFRKQAPAPQTSEPGIARLPATNILPNGTLIDLFVFLSEDPISVDFNDPSALIWERNGLTYGDWNAGMNGDGTFVQEIDFIPSENVKNNGSIYIHTFITKWDKPRTNLKDLLSIHDETVIYASRRLNKFKKRFFVKTQNLLTGETVATEEEIEKSKRMNSEIISHWHPNLTIALVSDNTEWVPGSIPAPINEYIEFASAGRYYKPSIFYNEFWNMKRDYMPINNTVQKLHLSLTYQPMSLFKWQLYLAQSARSKWTMNLYGESGETESEDDDQDSLKEMLLETNPYLIGATVIISILHSVFELLAFKNDIQFWNNRESLEGLSVRSVMFNVFQSVIVFLYVLDNEANMMITISCFVSLLIEVWKINKVVDFSLNRENKLLGVFPKIVMTDKGSYVESSTKQYDQLAFKYLSWILFPLLAGYACYSLLYLEHKGWYSWVLNMLYGFLLMFGFIMMTPQLFINYKLKSVAHLPWRMMSYKFLNTFIDDIFAFVIKMPTMYRIGCLRDDVVFFVFLYQRWIYKTDPSRLNEFGYSADMEAQVRLKKESTDAVANGEALALKSAEEKKQE